MSAFPQLTDVIVEMASNMMLVDDHVLWMAQIEDKACTSIVRSLEKIAAYTLSTSSQYIAVVGHTERCSDGEGRVAGCLELRNTPSILGQLLGTKHFDRAHQC